MAFAEVRLYSCTFFADRHVLAVEKQPLLILGKSRVPTMSNRPSNPDPDPPADEEPSFCGGKPCKWCLCPDCATPADITQEQQWRSSALARCNARLQQEAEKTASAVHALHRMKARYRDFFDKVGRGIAQWTPDGKLLTANMACATMLGFSSVEELNGAYAGGNFSLCDDEAQTAFLCAELERKDFLRGFEVRLRQRTDTTVWGRINTYRVTEENGSTAYYEAFIENVTDRKAWEERLAFLAFYDPLTRLANRTLFESRLEQRLRRDTHQPAEPTAVLYLNLDRFRDVNDVHGHAAGDEVLRLAATRLCSCVREEDTVARFSGDEFAILMGNVTRRSTVVAVARRIYEVLHEPISLDGHDLHIGVSIGIVLRAEQYALPEEILRDAEIAMRQAKIDPHRSVRFFNEHMRIARICCASLAKELRAGERDSEFYFEYQPIVDLRKNTICGVEALMRWRRRGVAMSPAKFIPVAEETGLIKSIGSQMLELACAQAATWKGKGLESFSMHINISARQLEEPGFVRDARRIFEKTEVDPRQLCFEITESILLDGGNVHMRVITLLRALGVRFCLDDFGTGFSSLSYLRRLPIDSIKLDRSFVAEFETDPKALAVARNLIRLGRELDLSVVVEGVERATQVALLNAIGAELVQGFYYHKPLGVAAAERLLRSTPTAYVQ